jgi:hypothetical protein
MRRVLLSLAFPALLLVYIGCGGGDAESGPGSSTRKGSSSKGKGGTGGAAGKSGSTGEDLPAGTTGSGGEFEIEQQEPDTCSHDACDPGLPLPEACSTCVTSICAAQPSCCLEHWDDTCTHLARGFDSCKCAEGGLGTGVGGSSSTGTGGSSTTGSGGASSNGKGGTTSSGGGGASTSSGGASASGGSSSTPVPSCSHTPCEAGGPLKTKCSLCAAQVCAQNATCCQTDWGQPCLQLAANTPGCACAPGTGSGGTSGAGASGGATGSGANGSGATGGSTGSGANGSGATGGSTGSGANGSGANGSGANGSGATGGTTGSGSNGSGANGSGATGGTSGSGSSSTGGTSGSGSTSGSAGGAGWLEGGAGGESGGCHSPCEEGDALSKSCGLVPFGICLYDPFCCDSANGSWNESCVGYATKLFLCPKKDGDDRDDAAACEHDVCAIGKALRADCDDCTAKVCAGDSYCCDTTWDGLCLGKASQLCGKCTEGKEGTCEHSACAVGTALKSGCTECVTTVCQKDPTCCTDSWDAYCAGLGAEECECGKTCDHEPCEQGTALSKSCSETTKSVCADDPYCCNTTWDVFCVDAAGDKGACGEKCGHDPCKTGTALHAECGDCEKKICELDPSCCDVSHGWDLPCTFEVGEVCGKTCEN